MKTCVAGALTTDRSKRGSAAAASAVAGGARGGISDLSATSAAGALRSVADFSRTSLIWPCTSPPARCGAAQPARTAAASRAQHT
jgi:hypothetical protein